MLGIKQEALALELGDDWSQKKVSRLEENEKIDDEILEQVAKILRVPVEAIKSFDEEKAIFNIQNNYEGSNKGASNVAVQNYQCSFNPIDKIIELYEALLKSERDKVEIFQKMFPK